MKFTAKKTLIALLDASQIALACTPDALSNGSAASGAKFADLKEKYCQNKPRSMLTLLHDFSYSFEKDNLILCGPVKWIRRQPECMTSGAWVHTIALCVPACV